MNVYSGEGASKKLRSKLDRLEGPGLKQLAERIGGAMIEGNRNDRLSGLDCHGRPQTPVKPRKGRYKLGTGPPLAPFGAASRVVTNFRAAVTGQPGRFVVTAGWWNVVSKSGVPFLPFLDRGVTGRSGKGGKAKARPGFLARVGARVGRALKGWHVPGRGSWHIPARPIFGISPRTWKRIDDLIDDFKKGK